MISCINQFSKDLSSEKLYLVSWRIWCEYSIKSLPKIPYIRWKWIKI